MASDDELLRTARELYEHDCRADQHNRDNAAADFRFYSANGEQWDANWRAQRLRDKKPVLEVPQLRMYVNQVVNDARLNPPGIIVRPEDDAADSETAKVLGGLIRNIESQSQAEIAYIRALEHAVIGGMGHFVVRAEYSRDDGWEMDLRIRPVYSPDAVVWDAGASHPLRTDADHVFVTDMIPRRQFSEEYPDVPADDWGTDGFTFWRAGDFVRIAEYWYKKPVTKTLWLLRTGQTIDATDLDRDARDWYRENGLIQRERRVEGHRICSVKMTANALLTEPVEWPGAYFPVVPVLGAEVPVGDRVIRTGLVRAARDVQTLINVHTSALAESIGMSTKPKWLLTPDEIAGHEATWALAHIDSFPYLLHNRDPSAPADRPARVPPDLPNQALLAQLGLATGDLQRVMGIFPASLGQEDNSKSGRAILLRQKEGDVGTFHYIDNLRIAVEHAGRILIDLIPYYYDAARKVRVLGEDGATEIVPINGSDPLGRPINDLSRGKYDVVAKTGPSFSTRREEGMQFLLEMMRVVPAAQSIAPDLLAKAADVPYADELAKRFRRMLIAQGVVEPGEDDEPPAPQPPSPEQMIAQAELVKAQAKAQEVAAEQRIAALEAAIKVIMAGLDRDELRLKAAEALTRGVKVTHDMQNDDKRLRMDAATKMIGALARQSGGTGAPN